MYISTQLVTVPGPRVMVHYTHTHTHTHTPAASMWLGIRQGTYTGLFISPSGISELDCATTKTNTAERSISIGRKSLQVLLY